ncbi:hypothetical protein HD597_007005 [Nonomuraea thailandensis]|uniref:PDZ domain-containing protein n=1 Tax=Nonomuraea thailandensis TaxID=1188745 RepID=A0A9X2GLG8_9ACTN|nr:hypothetical protein [Nonomuraea thailandensis]MCP2359985.1 hypothetical protein [Nonomuraea thailandensis]
MTLPTLSLTLSPDATGIGVEYVLQAPSIPAGQAVCRLPIVIAGIPGAPLRTTDLHVVDDLGDLPLHEEDEPATPSFTYRRWCATRDTVGDVTVSYFAPVRVVDAATRNGPLFDLRAESGGVSGAGVTFLALPDTTHDYAITLRWTDRPGVTSHGEGDLELTGTAETLAYCYYMAGPMHRHPAESTGPFAMYWLTEPAFDVLAVATRIERIYRAMCDFFREPEPGHRVFIRKHPYPGNGGTALPRSFMFGWSAAQTPAPDDLADLLAHETAHNWPRLDGEHAATAWYTEGTAEYYSIVLSHRAGLIDDDAFLKLINERARAYYANPLQTLTNAEAGELFWKDQRAQRVPYGRGLFYLIDLNAKISSASGGGRSLDDLVLAVLDRQRDGEKVGVPEWLDLVAAELGETGRDDFAAMEAGRWMIPAPDALGPRFTREQTQEYVTELGFDLSSLETRTVTGLIPGSAAEEAGIREGDVILEAPAGSQVAKSAGEEITLTLQREDTTFPVSYAPCGDAVPSFRWKRV